MAIGAPEILIVAGIIVFLFGANKLPQLARSFGKAQGEYAKAKTESVREATPDAAEAAEDTDDARKARKAAEALGIDTAGKSVAELKAEVKAQLE